MYLSTHFTLEEFTASQTAARDGINNDLPDVLLPSAKRTCYGLEKVRTLLRSHPILISSGYRSAALNAAVKGSQGSQHLLAEAADFTAPTFGTPETIVKTILASDIDFDQCILEFGRWVHISFHDNPRKQSLVIDQSGTRAFT